MRRDEGHATETANRRRVQKKLINSYKDPLVGYAFRAVSAEDDRAEYIQTWAEQWKAFWLKTTDGGTTQAKAMLSTLLRAVAPHRPDLMDPAKGVELVKAVREMDPNLLGVEICNSCSIGDPSDPTRHAAQCFVWRRAEGLGDPELMIAKRRDTAAAMPGAWFVVEGEVAAGESWSEAAGRGAHAESGINVPDGHWLMPPFGTEANKETENEVRKLVDLTVMLAAGARAEASGTHSDLMWASMARITEMQTSGDHQLGGNLIARAQASLDRVESSGKCDTVARYGAPPKREARKQRPSRAGAQGEGPARRWRRLDHRTWRR